MLDSNSLLLDGALSVLVASACRLSAPAPRCRLAHSELTWTWHLFFFVYTVAESSKSEESSKRR